MFSAYFRCAIFNVVFKLQSLRNRDSNLEFIPFFFGMLLHFYIPCYYSDLLMEKVNTIVLKITIFFLFF